jgi:hypothetical protein
VALGTRAVGTGTAPRQGTALVIRAPLGPPVSFRVWGARQAHAPFMGRAPRQVPASATPTAPTDSLVVLRAIVVLRCSQAIGATSRATPVVVLSWVHSVSARRASLEATAHSLVPE